MNRAVLLPRIVRVARYEPPESLDELRKTPMRWALMGTDAETVFDRRKGLALRRQRECNRIVRSEAFKPLLTSSNELLVVARIARLLTAASLARGKLSKVHPNEPRLISQGEDEGFLREVLGDNAIVDVGRRGNASAAASAWRGISWRNWSETYP